MGWGIEEWKLAKTRDNTNKKSTEIQNSKTTSFLLLSFSFSNILLQCMERLVGTPLFILAAPTSSLGTLSR